MHKSLRLAAMLLVVLASPAHAAEGGLLSVNTGLMFWTLIIFGLVLFALYRWAFPHILGAVEAREAHIRELLAAAQRDREEAQALLEEQRRVHEEVRAQVQGMLAEGRAGGERLKEEILEEARREQQALIERTRRDLERQMESSLAEIRTQAVDLAIAAASKLLARNLDGDDNRRLVREYLQRIDVPEGSPVGAGV